MNWNAAKHFAPWSNKQKLSRPFVERVFSHGGIILRPHRSQMSDTLLSKLIFCKCNLSWANQTSPSCHMHSTLQWQMTVLPLLLNHSCSLFSSPILKSFDYVETKSNVTLFILCSYSFIFHYFFLPTLLTVVWTGLLVLLKPLKCIKSFSMQIKHWD